MMKEEMKTLVKYNLAEDFWLQKLEDVVYHSLYGNQQDREDSAGKDFGQQCFTFPTGLTETLRAITDGAESRAFLVFITALNILAFKYLGSEDILITVTGFKKDTTEDDKDVPVFFRTRIDADSIPRDLLNTALDDLNKAYKHRQYEYRSFLNRFSNEKTGDKDALFALGLIYEDFNRDSPLTGHMDLLFRIGHSHEELVLTLRYDTHSYHQDQVEQLGRHFMNGLAAMLNNLDKPIRHLEILSEEDRRRLLVEFSGQEIEYSPTEKTFIPAFQRQVAGTPHAAALVCNQETLSYGELDETAAQLARCYINHAPLLPEDLVAILMERTQKIVIAITAAWKCGTAYVPIDPDFPDGRIKTIVEDSRVKLLISEPGLLRPELENTLKSLTNVLYLDNPAALPAEAGRNDREINGSPGSLAYVIYTSGSTGKPKGVMVEHRGMMNHLYAKAAEIQIGSRSVIAQNASQCFDISIWQFFAALLAGGRTVIYTNRLVLDPGELIKQIGRNSVTILEVVPSYLTMMLDIIDQHKLQHSFPALKYLLVTGETVKPVLVRHWFQQFPHIKMVNAYGPTEASDDITHFIMDRPPETASIPIGKTVRNFKIYIVNPQMNLCPPGVKGEICVAGLGVGRGYLNNPELTSEKFKIINYKKEPGSSINMSYMSHMSYIYQTGDLGRWLPDGSIEFFGRKDYQVKIRGYRIELEEIENKLSALPGIKEAVVIDREDKANNKYLCAYITLTGGSGEKTGNIKRELRTVLPEYMIPAAVVVLQALPLTSNGKVDRKALPEPDSAEASQLKYVAPFTPAQKKAAEIWQEVLGIEKIGIHDNFFNLGGDSFKGIRIVNKLQEWLEEVVHVTILFLAPTIEELALKLESYKKQSHTRIDAAKIEKMRRLIQPLPPLPPGKTSAAKNPPMIFILCPPRSGSTLLRVILTGHPGLFAPQEFELMTFNTLQERNIGLSGKFSFYLEGVIRAIMEIKHCDADEAKKIMEELEARDLTSQEFYRVLQQWLGNRMLIEKTPAYTLDLKILERIEEYFDNPYYIHLVRNPYAVIHSFENAKLDQIFKYDHDFTSRELAELVWLISHQNIKEFLEKIPARRKHQVKYEELVSDPEAIVFGICDFLGLEFYRQMLKVYEDAGSRMTDGIYTESKMLGDVKFFTHSSISTVSVEKWKTKYKTAFLGEEAVQVARSFGYLRESTGPDYTKLEPVPEAEFYELSQAQKRLWILNRLEKNSSAYNIANAFILEGNLDRQVLERAIEAVIKRHESLRTTFMVTAGKPGQKIHSFESMGNPWEYIDLQSRENPGQELEKLVAAEGVAPFDLEKGPLLRIKLIQSEDKRWVFLITLHHIISDGWSTRLLLRDILILYDAYKRNQPSPLPPLKFQYKDYSVWQNSKKIRETLQKQEQYWLREFEAEIPVLNLPIDYPRPVIQDFSGDFTGFELNPGETAALQRLARSEGVSLFMLLLAVYCIFLSKISCQEEILVGTPTAGRHHPDLEKIIGMFVNTLVLHHYIPGEQLFTGFLHRVKQETLDAYENQDYQFEYLVEKIRIERDISRNPMFDVMLVLQNISEVPGDAPIVEMQDLTVKSYPQPHTTAKFDLTLTAVETRGKLHLGFEYCTKLFKTGTILRFTRYFKRILSQLIENPQRKISGLEIISAPEKHQLLFDFNQTKSPYPGDKTIDRLFAEQAEQTPDHTVLVAPLPLNNRTHMTYMTYISYKELNQKSHQMAQWLAGKGVGYDTIVAIMGERSLETITGILAILKAGGAYLPIDPDYPQERIDFMLKDSDAKLLLIHKEIAAAGFSSSTLTSTSTCQVSPANLAYIIYTSGSTGSPKGVMITHRNVTRLVKNTNYVELTPKTRVLQTGALVFDASTFEIWGSLLNGSRLILTDKEVILNAFKMAAALVTHRVNTLWLSAPLFNQLEQQNPSLFSPLSYLLVGGDVLSPSHINRVKEKFPHLEIINGYGPTENTTFSTTYLIEKMFQRNIPIGRPINNSTAYIIDQYGHLVPVGVTGELIVGGDGVGRGYLNDPELTAEKFDHDLWDYQDYHDANNQKLLWRVQGGGFLEKSPPGRRRLYKTGDLARRLEDGNIEFLGRIDHQVKIRGFRVELGEIENQLLDHVDIKEAVVVVKSEQNSLNYLCAYIVAPQELDIPGLQEYLSGKLPDYMIPAYFVQLEAIPLTPNGKVDRKALPEPGIKPGKEYIPPGDEVEEKLAKIWSEVLGIEKDTIGIDYNFFQIGGHSLKATALIAQIHQEFDMEIPLVDIFKNPTIKGIASLIKSEVIDFLQQNVQKRVRYAAIEAAEEKEYYALSSAQQRLYFLQQMDLKSTGYNMTLVNALEDYLPLEKLESLFKQLIKRHESLRTSFHMVEDKPVQVIHDQVEFGIEYYDLATEDTEDTEGKNYKLQITNKKETKGHHSFIVRPFELSRAPLMRVGVVKLPHTPSALRGHPSQEGKMDKHLLMLDMHHIITDGASLEILIKEFLSLSRGEQLPPLKLRYRDFSTWQNRRNREERVKAQGEYWQKIFADPLPLLNLPYDYPRPLIQSYAGNSVTVILNEQETRIIKDIGQQAGATLYMSFLCLYTIFLSKLSGQADIVVGTPTAGRRHVGLKGLVGMMANTLAMRNYPTPGKPFNLFLNQVKTRTLEAFENQDYQFEDLVDLLAIQREISRNPLFDVMFNLLNQAEHDNHTPVLTGKNSYEHQKKTSKFDMTWTLTDLGNHLVVDIDYCTNLFKPQTLERFINYFKQLLQGLAKEKTDSITLAQLEIIPPDEKRKILVDFNDTGREYPQNKPLHRLFQEQAEQTPDYIATAASAEIKYRTYMTYSTYISYRQLNEKSAQLAGWLIEKGVQTDTIVGIMMERSLEMVIGILSILKAGAAYLPIDPEYPQDRIDFMLKDSDAKLLLTHKGIAAAGFSFSTLTSTSTCQVSPANLAYIIYTSGSTGRPKGVMVEHRSAVNVLAAMQKAYPLKESDSYLFKTSYSFDVSVTELFGWFWQGGKLVVLEAGGEKDPVKIINAIERSLVTHINFVPAMFNVFLQELLPLDIKKLSSLKYIFLAGEAVLPEAIDKFRQLNTTIILENIYGPTESTVYSSKYSLSRWDGCERIPIGTPLPNIQIYIMDNNRHLQPIGIPGELCIAGAGLARGYLNNPGLTTEKFCLRRPGGRFLKKLPPWTPRKNFSLEMSRSRFYRSYPSYMSYIYHTGDLARWLPDGNIEFLGRIDRQVKIRGFRIELEEIRHQLLDHRHIKDAAVLEKEKNNDKFLCAYIVSDRPPAITDLRDYLSQKLPAYMVPPYFVFIGNIPFTPNGKIDRSALPEPGSISFDGYIPPGDEVEEKLAAIWSEILGIEKDKIGIQHNFFHLGGNSLQLIGLVSKINHRFGIELPVTQIYENPIIKHISKNIKSKEFVESPVVLLNREKPQKIFCFPPQMAYSVFYLSIASIINDYSWYALSFIEEDNRLAKYVEIITGLQANGPYQFLGYSAAGPITFETAGALEKCGREVSDIIFLDSFFRRDRTPITQEFLQRQYTAIEEFLDSMGLPSLKEKVIQKSIKYMEYWKNINSLEKIHANVHLILSEEMQRKGETGECWEKLSHGKVFIYHGFGDHHTMLDRGTVEKNGEIIKKILDRTSRTL